MEKKGKYCAIRVRKQTRDALEELGAKGETFDDVITRLLKETQELLIRCEKAAGGEKAKG